MRLRFLFILILLFFKQLQANEEHSFSSYIKDQGALKGGYLSLNKDHPINNASYLYLKYGLEEFRKQQVDFILLDLDSPGGEVFSALRMVTELQKIDRDDKIPVIALVDDWALSAGALLAYSCRFIGVTSLASMGAAEPVVVSSDGNMHTAEEKMVSALRVEFAKAATLYGRNPLIAEAMVDKDMVVVIRKGVVTSLLSDAEIEPEDVIISSSGKLLTLDAKQLIDLSVANFSVPSLGILTGEKSLRENPFFAREIEWISYTNWKIDFFAFLSHPFVSSALMFGLIIGLYGFIQNPSSVVSLALGIGSLFFVLLSTFATQVVGVLELLIFCTGLILLLIDIFIASSGFLSAAGILLLVGGLIAMLLPSLEGVSFSFNLSNTEIVLQEWLYRFSLLLFAFVVAVIACVIFSRFYLHKSRFMKKIVLNPPEQPSSSLVLAASFIGAKGKAASAICPLGKVILDGKLYEAQTEGEFVSSSSNIEVIAVSHNRLVVKEIV